MTDDPVPTDTPTPEPVPADAAAAAPDESAVPEPIIADATETAPAPPEAAAPSAKETVVEATAEVPAAAAPGEEPSNKNWYVVKGQSGREESIKEAIERRVKIEGLEEFIGQIVIPVEQVTEMRNNKRVQKFRKLYPGYLMCEVEYNDRILYLF